MHMSFTPSHSASILPDRNILNPDLHANQCMGHFKDFFADFDELKAREILKGFQIPPTQNLKVSKGMKGMIEKLYFALVCLLVEASILDSMQALETIILSCVCYILARYLIIYKLELEQ